MIFLPFEQSGLLYFRGQETIVWSCIQVIFSWYVAIPIHLPILYKDLGIIWHDWRDMETVWPGEPKISGLFQKKFAEHLLYWPVIFCLGFLLIVPDGYMSSSPESSHQEGENGRKHLPVSWKPLPWGILLTFHYHKLVPNPWLMTKETRKWSLYVRWLGKLPKISVHLTRKKRGKKYS